MSAAASILQLESPTAELANVNPFDKPPVNDETEREALEKLAVLSPPTANGPVIAIDLDDVLSQTNEVVAEWHNEMYGTNMTINHFYYYYYWKNPFWGTPTETFDKVRKFYKTDRVHHAKPVPGAREGVQTLKNMGFRLIIVTARTEDNADESWKWVDYHFPGAFNSIICTGQFKDAHKSGHEVVTRLTKAEVCDDLKAILLIDDSAENALQCVTAEKATPVLLFGDYAWNKRLCGPGDMKDEMSFDIRFKDEGERKFWEEDRVVLPPDAAVWRVRDWSEAVRWIKDTYGKAGR